MNDEEFYAECAALLGVEHEGQPFPYYRRTRWNNRSAGRGRFAGHGVIRVFGSMVHVTLNHPKLFGIFPNKEDALVAIKNAMNYLD